MNQTTPPTKRIVAKSTAEYRATQIFETEEGIAVILREVQYDLNSLREAKALIDAFYADAARRVTMGVIRQ